MIVSSIAAGLTSPLLFVPAVVVGWLARSARMAAFGALAIAAVPIGLAALQPLPEGALLWRLPQSLVAPFAWALGVHVLCRWLRGRAEARPRDPLARVVRSIAGLFVGGFIGGAIGLAVAVGYVELADVDASDGPGAYAILLVSMFPGILVGMIVGAVLGSRLSRVPVGGAPV